MDDEYQVQPTDRKPEEGTQTSTPPVELTVFPNRCSDPCRLIRLTEALHPPDLSPGVSFFNSRTNRPTMKPSALITNLGQHETLNECGGTKRKVRYCEAWRFTINLLTNCGCSLFQRPIVRQRTQIKEPARVSLGRLEAVYLCT